MSASNMSVARWLKVGTARQIAGVRKGDLPQVTLIDRGCVLINAVGESGNGHYPVLVGPDQASIDWCLLSPEGRELQRYKDAEKARQDKKAIVS